MRVMILEQPGTPLQLRERPDPMPGRGQLLLKVKACAVCRTDLHIVEGDLPWLGRQVIPGHEIVGEVIRLDEDVSDFSLGDRVGVPWLGWTCGECRYCRAGQENLCDRARFTGYHIDGGFAELTVADARFCFAIAPSYDDMGAAAHLIAQVAVHQGRQVYAFTRPGDDGAQDFARSLGCVWAGDSTEKPPTELDAALIFAPVGAVVPAALAAVCKGGGVVCGGIHMSNIPAFPYSLIWGERVLRSMANLARRDAAEFLRIAPQVPVRTTVVAYALAEANAALSDLLDGRLTGAAVLIPQT